MYFTNAYGVRLRRGRVSLELNILEILESLLLDVVPFKEVKELSLQL